MEGGKNISNVLFLLQFTDAFLKYGIPSEANAAVLAVQICQEGETSEDMTKLIEGELVEFSRLSEFSDPQTIKQVSETNGFISSGSFFFSQR